MNSESRIEKEEAGVATDKNCRPGYRRPRPGAGQKHARRSTPFGQHRQNLIKVNGLPGRRNGGRRTF